MMTNKAFTKSTDGVPGRSIVDYMYKLFPKINEIYQAFFGLFVLMVGGIRQSN